MNRFVLMPELYGGNGLKMTDPFLRTVLALPPENAAFYCSPAFVERNRPLVRGLITQGREVRIGTLEGLGPDCIVLSNHYNKFAPSEAFSRVKNTGAKILFYMDYTEETGYVPAKDEFFIYSTEVQFLLCMPRAFFSLDASGAPEAGRMADGGEGAAVGLLRPDDITAGRGESREALREKLSKTLGVQLNDRPLAVHFCNHNLDSAPVEAGLKRLSERCDVLIKHHGTDARSSFANVEGPGIYNYYSLYASPDHHVSYLIRYAADAVLAGCFSGAAPTTLMMGARLIPVYTQKVYATMAVRNAGLYSSFAREMRASFRGIPLRITDCLPPICIEATDMLWEKINDREYWAEYERRLPSIQRAAFGRYLLGEAAVARMRALIVRLLRSGSFFESETQRLIQLSPDAIADAGAPL